MQGNTKTSMVDRLSLIDSVGVDQKGPPKQIGLHGSH